MLLYKYLDISVCHYFYFYTILYYTINDILVFNTNQRKVYIFNFAFEIGLRSIKNLNLFAQ